MNIDSMGCHSYCDSDEENSNNSKPTHEVRQFSLTADDWWSKAGVFEKIWAVIIAVIISVVGAIVSLFIMFLFIIWFFGSMAEELSKM